MAEASCQPIKNRWAKITFYCQKSYLCTTINKEGIHLFHNLESTISNL